MLFRNKTQDHDHVDTTFKHKESTFHFLIHPSHLKMIRLKSAKFWPTLLIWELFLHTKHDNSNNSFFIIIPFILKWIGSYKDVAALHSCSIFEYINHNYNYIFHKVWIKQVIRINAMIFTFDLISGTHTTIFMLKIYCFCVM